MDLSLTATDPDNNVLTYSAIGLPPGLSVDPVYGDITGSIEYGDAANGPYQATVTASNGNLSDSQSFLWDVTPAPPSIDNEDDDQWDFMNNGEGESVAVPVEASDIDGLPITFSATGLPPGLSIDQTSGLISGIVASGADNGTPYDVIVSVSSGGQTSTLEFPWTITLISLVAPADQRNMVGQTVSLPIAANDPDGDPLTYSADGLPDGLSIDPNSGLISGTIDDSAAGGMPWHVTIDVTDGTETAERTFNWTILPLVLPTISLANPGDQVNYTDDPINLPIAGNATGVDDLYYSASGLPDGLDIDPDTGIISGMDDDFNAPAGTVYTVTVTVADDYGQTTSQTFAWEFDADPAGPPVLGGDPSATPASAGAVSFAAQGIGTTPAPQGFPATHPTTEARTDAFDVNAFWANVELLPGGQAAENWFSSKNGHVEWAWLGVTTLGRWEQQADGSSIPVVYIPQRYNEAGASESFVNNITQSWVTGFADYSKIPTDGNPASWQEYIKERTKAMGDVVTTGAELYLSGLSIVNEGADWVVTVNDVATAKTTGQAAIAAIAFLPFITGASLKVLSKGLQVVQASAFQQKLITKFFKDYKTAGFGSKSVFDNMVNFSNSIILQRTDINYTQQQVVSMMNSKAPYALNINTREFEQIQLHHVDQYPESGGVIAEIFESENHSALLHPGNNGADNETAAWKNFRETYWRDRLQLGINNGWVPQSIIDQFKTQLLAKGFQLP